MVWRLSLSVLGAVALVGCGMPRRVDVRLHEDASVFTPDFPKRPPGAEVELWMGDTSREKIPIAIISSSRTADRSRASREAQLEELRARARDLGAHAVENVRVETAQVSGIIADPRVPFTAFKQGDFELHFVRGTAVFYPGDPDAATTP